MKRILPGREIDERFTTITYVSTDFFLFNEGAKLAYGSTGGERTP